MQTPSEGFSSPVPRRVLPNHHRPFCFYSTGQLLQKSQKQKFNLSTVKHFNVYQTHTEEP